MLERTMTAGRALLALAVALALSVGAWQAQSANAALSGNATTTGPYCHTCDDNQFSIGCCDEVNCTVQECKDAGFENTSEANCDSDNCCVCLD